LPRYMTDTEDAVLALCRFAELCRGSISPEVRLNDDKTLDEVVHPAAHLEQMDFNHWFLEIGDAGNSVAVWLHAKGKITATYEHRRDIACGSSPNQ
jgi:hypothetical protein